MSTFPEKVAFSLDLEVCLGVSRVIARELC